MESILIASSNASKIEEIREEFSSYFEEIYSPEEVGEELDVQEIGKTFRENAQLKARAYYEEYGIPALADDSGLCVNALGGEPGVHSSRFAGENATDTQNNQKLLQEMEHVPMEGRSAHFECVMHLWISDGLELISTGRCQGYIGLEPRGEKGFGYDPLFVPEGNDRTFSEMDQHEKNRISHRGRAVRKMTNFFEDVMNR